jgi:hypothetical protein
MKGMNFFSVLPSQPRTRVEIDQTGKHNLAITVSSFNGNEYEHASRVTISFDRLEQLSDLIIQINEAHLAYLDELDRMEARV